MRNDKTELYKLLEDAYAGRGGFQTGEYLVRHKREAADKYSLRQKLSYYLNYIKPCVDAHVAPVFKTLAVRDYAGPGVKAWELFANDVNFLGDGIDKLMKKAAHSSKLNGVAYIVMDMAEGLAVNSLADYERDRNNLPYAFVVDAIAVKEVVLDKFGRITKFVYAEPDADNEYTPATRIMTAEGWTLRSSKGERKGSWHIGCVPVIPLFSREHKTHDAFPPSEFASAARANLAIFNMCSWLNEIMMNQTFSVLTYPSSGAEEEITLGTNNALSYPVDSSHAPAFIAPPADPATVLATQIANLQQEIYRMAVVVNVTGSSKLQSGQAKAWDYEATNQILSDFADTVENAEMKVARMFSIWTGVALDYKVNYPSDFKISEVEQELANAEVAKGLNFGDGFDLEVFKRVLTSYLPELKADEFDTLVEEYRNLQEQQKLDYINSGEGNGEE